MSYRAILSRGLPALGIGMFWLAGAVAEGQVAVAPQAINFTYVQGASLPAPQKVAVSSAAGNPSYTSGITTTPPGGLWLTATPDTGVLPASVNFRVNPTGLDAGIYTLPLRLCRRLRRARSTSA